MTEESGQEGSPQAWAAPDPSTPAPGAAQPYSQTDPQPYGPGIGGFGPSTASPFGDGRHRHAGPYGSAAPAGPPPADGAPAPGWGTAPGWATAPGATQPGWGTAPPYAGWSYPPPAPLFAKPGVIPLRPLTLGDILDGALATVRRYPAATLGISVVIVSITQLLQFALLAGPLAQTRRLVADPATVSGADELLVAVPGLVVTLLATTLLTGFLTQVVGQAVLGEPLSLGSTWSRVRPRLLPLVGLSLLTVLGTALGAVLLIVPGIYLYVSWSLATPALVLERAGVRTALRRSRRLVRGSWWRTFGILLVVLLIRGILANIVALPFYLASGVYSGVLSGTTHVQTTGQLFLTTLGQIVAGTIVLPFAAGAIAMLYVDRRMRAEGLDLTLARAAQLAEQRAGGR